jgi:division protein CdvB (Snf7/Vps24/ESCRT-III family)
MRESASGLDSEVVHEHIEGICDTKLFVGRMGDRIGTVTVHEDNTLEVEIDEDVKEELRSLVPQDTLPK